MKSSVPKFNESETQWKEQRFQSEIHTVPYITNIRMTSWWDD
jgi:hypothetical protein